MTKVDNHFHFLFFRNDSYYYFDTYIGKDSKKLEQN